MYFTEGNAQKIDGVRRAILELSDNDLISDVEEKILVADLICAANRVAIQRAPMAVFYRGGRGSPWNSWLSSPGKSPESFSGPECRIVMC